MDEKTTKLLKQFYYEAESPGNFGSLRRLKETLKKNEKKVSDHDIATFLQGQRAHNAFLVRPRNFPRRSVIHKAPYDIISCDLGDLFCLGKYNSGIKWVFLAICNFTKKLFLTGIQSKGTADMKKAFDLFMESVPSQYKVHKIWSDRGQEYVSCKTYLLDKYGVEIYHTNTSRVKASLAERNLKTVLSRLYRWMDLEGNFKWTQYLARVQDSFNNSHHRSLPKGITPNEIVKDAKLVQLTKKNYGLEIIKKNKLAEKNYEKERRRDPEGIKKLYVGDLVRTMEDFKTFDKSYKSGWSQNISPVVRIKETIPRQYFVGSSSKPFYRNELSKVVNSTDIREKNYFIAQTRKIQGRETRSGAKSNQEVQYLLKSRQDPTVSYYISEAEKNKLEKLGQLNPEEDG